MTESGAELRGLVDAARTGDPDAWEVLYRRAYPRLFAYARRRVRSDAQAEDAVSETMTRAIARISTFVWSGSGVDGWLFGIARNVVLESYREDARAAPTDPLSVPEPVATGTSSGDPLDDLVTREEHALVLTAFGRLAESDRELLELRVVAGLDSRQVAEATTRQPGAVRTAQSRALARLRMEFEGLMT